MKKVNGNIFRCFVILLTAIVSLASSHADEPQDNSRLRRVEDKINRPRESTPEDAELQAKVDAERRKEAERQRQAKGDRELEGIEGTRLEEVLIPAGRTRKVHYTAPKSAGTQKLKCYIPGGPATIIEVRVTAS